MYDTVVAGHEEATPQQSVIVQDDESSREINALFAHLDRLHTKKLLRRDDAMSAYKDFFLQRPPWPIQRFKEVMNDVRLEQYRISISGFDEEFSIKPSLLGAGPAASTERVIDADYLITHIFPNMEDQSSRVLVDRTNHGESQIIGGTTRNALVVLAGSGYNIGGIFSPGSVIINIGETKKDQNIAFEVPPLIYLQKEQRLVYRSGNRGDVNWHPDSWLWTKRLDQYVNQLLEDCEDPHGLHGKYGPTPVNTIRQELNDILDESLSPRRRAFAAVRRWFA